MSESERCRVEKAGYEIDQWRHPCGCLRRDVVWGCRNHGTVDLQCQRRSVHCNRCDKPPDWVCLRRNADGFGFRTYAGDFVCAHAASGDRGASVFCGQLHDGWRSSDSYLAHDGCPQDICGGSLDYLGSKRKYTAQRVPKCSWHVTACFRLLAFGGYAVSFASEPVVSYRDCPTCEVANQPSSGFFRANILIYRESVRISCTQRSDRPV